MKSAEEYIVRLYITDDGEPKCVHDTVENVLEAIKIAQRDAIDEAVKMCLNECAYVNYPLFDGNRIAGSIVPKENILQVADKLKQEIN